MSSISFVESAKLKERNRSLLPQRQRGRSPGGKCKTNMATQGVLDASSPAWFKCQRWGETSGQPWQILRSPAMIPRSIVPRSHDASCCETSGCSLPNATYSPDALCTHFWANLLLQATDICMVPKCRSRTQTKGGSVCCVYFIGVTIICVTDDDVCRERSLEV